MIKFVLSALIAMHISIPVAKDLSLSYNLKVGDRFELRQKTTQKIVQTIMGMDQSGSNTYDGTIAMRVVAAESGTMRMEARMVKLKSHMKNFLNETDIDSEGDMENSSNKIVHAMMNRPFFVTISKSGAVEKVEDVANLWAGVDELDVSQDEKDNVKKTIGQMINESSFKNGLGQAFLTYAGKPVKLQEVWTTQSGIPADFPVRSDNNWHVESASSSHAVVHGEGIFRTTDKDKVVLLPGEMKAKVDLSGNQKVNGTASTKSGLPEKVLIDAKLSGIILLLAGGMLPIDVEVPIDIETHTEYSFVKK
jgi:hypothetical protein